MTEVQILCAQLFRTVAVDGAFFETEKSEELWPQGRQP
jgi:hypothetical protein